MRKTIFTVFLLLTFSTPALGVTAEVPGKHHPRPSGLAGCACFWDVQFDLDKKSSRFAFELFEELKPARMRPKLSPTGLHIFRGERDLCNRYRSTPAERESVSRDEGNLLRVLGELASEEGVKVHCGVDDGRGDLLCSCPVPGVKLSN
jgi:hypothetical protein